MTGRSCKHLLKKVLQCFLLCCLALFLQPVTANAQPGIFSATGAMTTSRGGPTATLLSNGEVLLAGGCVDARCTYVALASAELYNPATGTFSATGSMNATRFDGQTATLLPNGQVLVAGGYGTNYVVPVPDAEVYDPATGTFSPTGAMVAMRYQHTATLLPNGKVLVAGGCFDSGGSCPTLASAELYDPATGTFSPTGSMIAGRACHTATLLPNGQVLIAGGVDFNTYTSLASAELYDPTTGTFSATGSMITGRDLHSAALLPNGKVLVATGFNYSSYSYLVSAELYDPATGTFSATGSMTTGRIYQAAALTGDGKFLIAGGAGNPGLLASAELYNPATGTFSATGSLITARDSYSLTLLPSGQVLATGGDNYSGPLASAELYSSQTITFTTNAPTSAVYNSNFTVAATGGASGNPVTFTSSGACSNVGATYTMTSGTGTCSVIANQAGNSVYPAAPTVTQTVTATLASQTITFTTNAPASAIYNSGFPVAATGGASGNPVIFTSFGACSNVGAAYTMTSGTGTCSVIANQAGNNNYSAASTVTQTVAATLASQTITFTTNAPPSAIYNSGFAVAATGGGSGNAVTFTSSGACSNVGATYTMTSGAGACSVIANQTGNTNYSVAPTVTQTVTANPASQTIAFTQSGPAQAPYNSSFTVAASASSGQPVSFSSSGVCSNLGATFTMTNSTGTCTVIANQSGNANYLAAPTVTETTAAAKAAQTVTFTGAPPTAPYQSTFTVTATTNTGITPTITAAGSCSISGTTVSMKSGTGLCTMTAKWAGNTNYLATSVTQTTTAEKLVSLVDWAGPAAITYGTALSGVQLDAIANVAGSFVYSPAAGAVPKAGSDTLKVTFTPTLSKDYATATVSVVLQVNQAASIITWTAPAAIAYGTALSGTQLDATASVPGKFVYSPAAGKVLTAGTQTLSVTFTPTDHVDYSSATETVTLVVNKVGTTTTITSNTPNPSTHGNAVSVHFTVTAATNYKAPTSKVTVNASTGESCTGTLVNGSSSCSVTFGAAGPRTLTATYAGDSNNDSSISAGVAQTVN